MFQDQNQEEFAAIGWEGFRNKKAVLEEYRAFKLLSEEEDQVIEQVTEVFDTHPDQIGSYIQDFFAQHDILETMNLLCTKVKEQTYEIAANYPYKFWELKLESESLQTLYEKSLNEKEVLEEQLRYTLNQAQLTENQQKMRSFTNSVSLREQLSNRLTTPKNSFGAKDLRSTVKSECKLSKTRPLFAEFQSEIAQINNYLSSTENISPCIKEVFVHWKDRNNRRDAKELYSLAIRKSSHSREARTRASSIKRF